MWLIKTVSSKTHTRLPQNGTVINSFEDILGRLIFVLRSYENSNACGGCNALDIPSSIINLSLRAQWCFRDCASRVVLRKRTRNLWLSMKSKSGHIKAFDCWDYSCFKSSTTKGTVGNSTHEACRVEIDQSGARALLGRTRCPSYEVYHLSMPINAGSYTKVLPPRMIRSFRSPSISVCCLVTPLSEALPAWPAIILSLNGYPQSLGILCTHAAPVASPNSLALNLCLWSICRTRQSLMGVGSYTLSRIKVTGMEVTSPFGVVAIKVLWFHANLVFNASLCCMFVSLSIWICRASLKQMDSMSICKFPANILQVTCSQQHYTAKCFHASLFPGGNQNRFASLSGYNGTEQRGQGHSPADRQSTYLSWIMLRADRVLYFVTWVCCKATLDLQTIIFWILYPPQFKPWQKLSAMSSAEPLCQSKEHK